MEIKSLSLIYSLCFLVSAAHCFHKSDKYFVAFSLDAKISSVDECLPSSGNNSFRFLYPSFNYIFKMSVRRCFCSSVLLSETLRWKREFCISNLVGWLIFFCDESLCILMCILYMTYFVCWYFIIFNIIFLNKVSKTS